MIKLPRPVALPLISLIVLVVPVSPNYNLRELNIGGGGGTSRSDNYASEQTVGELGGPMSGTSYGGGLGIGFTQMANVPPAPTVTNPANYYDKLHVVIDQGDNPSDTLYAIGVSSDDFATTQYVLSDHGLADTVTFADYQTFASWGGGGGFDILGLDSGTTYKVRVKAMQGDFTESGFGPPGSATTVNPTLTFDIDVASSDQQTSPPYTLDLGTLLAGTVTTGADKIWVSLDTNALSGANVFVAGQNGSLLSPSASYQLDSVTGNLSALPKGFGLQGSSVSQDSGGPLSVVTPYNGGSDTVGQVTTTFQQLFTTTAPITGGRASAVVKAKADSAAPAKSDYSEILTVIGAANF